MAIGSICEDCINRYHCIFDSYADVKRCVMYNQKPDLSVLFDQIAEKIADKVAEKLKEDLIEAINHDHDRKRYNEVYNQE